MQQAKKAVEAVPFNLLITLFLIVLLLSIVFYEMSFFSNYRRQQTLISDVESLKQAMTSLKQTTEQGSFISRELLVPSNYRLVVDNESDCFLIFENKSLIYNFSVEFDILYGLELSGAEYNLELFYGQPQQIKNLTIYFV